jgi:regulator of sirC expression with transglutaminase-like and TPR domain
VRQQRLDEALEAVDMVLDLNPNDVQALSRRGDILR